MMASGVPTDHDGNPIRNDPGAVVVRVYRVGEDGLTLHDIGGALVAPYQVNRIDDIQAALAGVLGTEIVKAIGRDVYGPVWPCGERAPASAASHDFIGDYLKELGNATKHDDATK